MTALHRRNGARLPVETQVAIVGAGPTGLALANGLAARGIPFALLDRLAEGASTSRAAVLHARTLEVLEPLGVSERLRAVGCVVPRFSVRDRDRVLLTVRFDRLPTRYPYTLMVPQNVTEAILSERLGEQGGVLHRRCEVTDVREERDEVRLQVATGRARLRELRARYAVGTDGMYSRVRACAGIGFAGGAYEQAFVLADVRMSWALRPDEVVLFFSPEGLVVVAPLPGGRHRVVATVDDAPLQPGIRDVQRLLDARGPTDASARIHEIAWSSRFHVHHRLAERFRAGRILLAGDAAHVHSPAGGQGLNTGIQDAVALADALASALLGRDGEEALDRYEQGRRPVARHVVAVTDRMTRAATLRGERARALRNGALRLLGRVPAVRRRLAFELAELDVGRRAIADERAAA